MKNRGYHMYCMKKESEKNKKSVNDVFKEFPFF